jgi:hypothetical protein
LLWSEEKETFEPDFVAVIDSELAKFEGEPNNLWLRGYHEKVADLDLYSVCGKPFQLSAFGCYGTFDLDSIRAFNRPVSVRADIQPEPVPGHVRAKWNLVD